MCMKWTKPIVMTVIMCFAASITHADLIAYWPLDEGSGDVAADIIGGFEAQLTSVDWVAGQFDGFALETDRSGDEILAGPGPTPTTQDLSISWWMVDDYESFETIMNKAENTSTAGYSMLLRPESEVSPLLFRIGGFQNYGGWGVECSLPTGAYSKGEWTHIACTYDSPSDTATIYCNGELAPNGDNNPKTGIAGPGGYCEGVNDPTQPLYIVGQREAFGGIVDEVAIWDEALTPDEVMAVYILGPERKDPRHADDANPADGAVDVPRDLVLDWTPGIYAAKHNVYLGTSLEDVSNSTTPTAADLDVNSFDPGRLEFGKTYFWRVDEVNGTADRTVFKSSIWSFEVEPYSIQIPGSEIIVTASSFSNEFSIPEKTLDGSGLGEDNTHDIPTETMWFSAMGETNPWIQYEFDNVKKLDIMKVWNSNSSAEGFIGYGIKGVEIQYSTDGETWDVFADVNELSRAPGVATYNQYDEIDLGGLAVKMVRLNILSNWGGFMQAYSVSEVQFSMIPAAARTPVPASGSIGIAPDAMLSWRAGRGAAQSIVYASTDANEVADGSAASATSNTNSINLSALDVQVGQIYYWRVDEVNNAEVVSVWAGPVWSLETMAEVVVDDFESYGNDSPNRAFQAWLDGYGYSADEFFPAGYNGNGTDAGVGHDIWSVDSLYYNGDIMETATTHAGSNQSLPFYYSGNGSQIDRTFAPSQDWTAGGVRTLVLWLRSSSSNAAADKLYVKINNTKVTYDGDLVTPIWQQWNIDLAASGVNLNAVTKLSIGVEGNGSGLVYLDDIILYRVASPVMGPPAGGDKSLVAHWTFDETEGLTAADSSGYGNEGILTGMVGTEWTTGTKGGALEFNGSTQVHIEHSDSLQLSSSVTIAAWVKMNAGNEEAYMGIGGKLKTDSYQGFALVRHSSGVFRLWADNGNGDIAGFDASSDVTYTDTEWHHVAGVVDDGTSSLYVDGVKQVKEGAVALTDSGQHAHIGIQYSEYDQRFWTGLIDDVRIYYRALSAQEISGL